MNILANETKKKGISWFNSVLSQQNEENHSLKEELEVTEIDIVEPSNTTLAESQQQDESMNKEIFSKDNQDKIALDVIVSIENILKDRQLQFYKQEGLVDQLDTANETINRLKQELIKKEQLLQEKNKENRELETKLTNKQMNYDQLLEDYKEYQLNSNIEYEKISNQLETSTTKYNKLNEDFTQAQYQSMLKINDLEDKIRNLEIENQKYTEQYQKIVDDKAKLMKTINDFTERMSFTFSTNDTSSNE